MITVATDIYERLLNAKLFIDNNFDEQLDLAMISSHANLSVFHFHRLFTKIYRITPHQYLVKKRLNKAMELLRTGDLAVSFVCTNIGFESHGSFTTLFKKHHGITPGHFRNNARRKQELSKVDARYVIPNCFIR